MARTSVKAPGGQEEVVAYRSWRPVRLTVFIAWGACPNVVAKLAAKYASLADRALIAWISMPEHGCGLGPSPSLK